MVAFVASVTSKAIQLGESVDMITPQPKMNVKMNTRHFPVPCLRSQHAMVVVIDQWNCCCLWVQEEEEDMLGWAYGLGGSRNFFMSFTKHT